MNVLEAGEGTGARSPRAAAGSPRLLSRALPYPVPLLLASVPAVFALTVQRPVIHPLSSPSNRFCVTSLDPDTLPAVATLLMDVMFYSNGYGRPLGRERLQGRPGRPRGHGCAWEPRSEWGDTELPPVLEAGLGQGS